MSDFELYVRLMRGATSRALGSNPEQAAWILADITRRITPEEIAEFTWNMDESVEDVAAFWRRFANLIEAEGNSL